MAMDIARDRAALDWYEERREEFLSALQHAHATENWPDVVELATTFAPFLTRRSYWADAQRTMEWGLDAARQIGDVPAEARLLAERGNVHRLRSRWAYAIDDFQAAWRLFGQLGDR